MLHHWAAKGRASRPAPDDRDPPWWLHPNRPFWAVLGVVALVVGSAIWGAQRSPQWTPAQLAEHHRRFLADCKYRFDAAQNRRDSTLVDYYPTTRVQPGSKMALRADNPGGTCGAARRRGELPAVGKPMPPNPAAKGYVY